LPNIESEILLTEIVSVFSTSESQLTFQSTVPFLNLNKELINQILINLISNGLKYNNSKTPKVNISLTEDEVNYCFEVKDNGIGISVKNQDRIFNLFETFNSTDRSGNKGTGIGLATVKKLVTKLNGTINVSSTEGEGSVFTCIIPKSR
jgi:signal transduction histidine kinase